MTRTFILATVASLALGFAASSASAQTAGMHSPPSDRAAQGGIVDPNFHPSAGGILDPNIRKTGGDTIDPNFRKTSNGIIDPNDRRIDGTLVPAVKPAGATSLIDPNYRPSAGGIIDPNVRKSAGGAIDPNERMGLVEEDRKLVGTTSQTYTPGNGGGAGTERMGIIMPTRTGSPVAETGGQGNGGSSDVKYNQKW